MKCLWCERAQNTSWLLTFPKDTSVPHRSVRRTTSLWHSQESHLSLLLSRRYCRMSSHLQPSVNQYMPPSLFRKHYGLIRRLWFLQRSSISDALIRSDWLIWLKTQYWPLPWPSPTVTRPEEQKIRISFPIESIFPHAMANICAVYSFESRTNCLEASSRA